MASAAAAMAASNSLYMLQWHEHHTSFFRLMEELCREQSLTDVTITCGDVSLEAHSLILGASSPILRSILAKGEGKKQTLHFMDMNPYHMQLLLQYMYRGEISVPQNELGPLMTSARSLQIKGLTSTTVPPSTAATGPGPPPILPTQPGPPPPTLGEDRLSELANYLATQPQQPLAPHHPPGATSTTTSGLLMPPGDLQPLDASGLINLEPPQQPVLACSTSIVNSAPPNISTVSASNVKNSRKRPTNNQNLKNSSTNPSSSDHNNKNKKRRSKKPFEELRRDSSISANGDSPMPDSSNIKHLGEIHEDDADEGTNGVGGVTAENWSDQQTIKVKGHRIPVLPKPLSQMKTTETRSYLSRLIWATNGWKRPQYGNPETKPVWWPNDLLNWAEMKKMGGKKADGLSNVNYNEIQKTILNEGYKYFGFDPETLCHIKSEPIDHTGSQNEDQQQQQQPLSLIKHEIHPQMSSTSAVNVSQI